MHEKVIKIIKTIVVNMCVLTMMLLGSINTLAASDVQIYIYPNQVWNHDYDYTDKRSGSYSYVTAQNHSVRPVSGVDLFTKIQARATNSYGLEITDTVILNEGTASASKLYIREGYLNWDTVGFQFRGNTSSEAYAIVSYDAM